MAYSSSDFSLKLLERCANCNFKFNAESIGIKTLNFSATRQDNSKLALQNELSVEIVDIIWHIYGISYRQLLGALLEKYDNPLLLKDEVEDSGEMTVDNSSKIVLCSNCAILFENLYDAYRNFDKVSSTESVLTRAIKNQRRGKENDENVKLEVPDPVSNELATDWGIETFPFFEENEDKGYQEETEDPLDGLEYMTNCQVVLSEINSVKKETKDESLIKRTRRKTYAHSNNYNEREPTTGEKIKHSKSSKNAIGSKPKRKISSLEKANRKRRKRGFGRKKRYQQKQQILKMVNLKEFEKNLVETTDNDNIPNNECDETLQSSSAMGFKWVICCGIRFVCQYELSEHKSVKHNNADSIPCELCQKVIVIEEMSNHLFKIHRIKPAHFAKAFELNEAEAAVEVSVEERKTTVEGDLGDNERYTCEFCGATIIYLDELLPHMIQHKEYSNKRGPNKIIYPLDCCNTTLKNADSYERHRREKHNKSFLKVQCQFCDLIIPKGYIKGHLQFVHRYTKEKTIKCPKCDLTFAGEYCLSIHQKNEGHEEDVSCGVANCTKVFKNFHALKIHKRFSHFGELKYACQFCSKLFRSPSTRRQHEFKHETEFKFVCDECGKAFTMKKRLLTHLKRHADEKLDRENFKCNDCGKNFKHNEGLKKHIRIFHREDLKKIFTCELCGKTTNNMTNMRIHQRIHDTNRVVNTKKGKTPAKETVPPENVIVSNLPHWNPVTGVNEYT